MRRIIGLAIACAAPGALLAQETVPTPAATSATKAEKEKKVCRSEETTGSMMPTRVCHTKSEWTQIDAANARTADQFNTFRRTGRGMNGSGS